MREEVIETTGAPEVAAPLTINDLKPKMKLTGKVERLELYGAFIDIGVGVNALIHISQLSEGRVNRVSDALKVGDEVTVWVEKVDPQTQQIMVTMIQPLAVDWSDLKVGNTYTGTVSRLETFGAFVNIGAEREGLVHISELSHDYVKSPGEVVKVGDEVQVQVLGFSKRKRRIDLSMKALLEKPEPVHHEPASESRGGGRRGRGAQQVEVEEYAVDEEEEELPTAMEVALRRAMGSERLDAIRDGRKKNKKARQRERGRSQQEELLRRTLQLQD